MNTQGSLGDLMPWQSHTEREVRRPGALSEAGSRGTPQITGVACGAETRHSERRAEPGAVACNAGSPGGSSERREICKGCGNEIDPDTCGCGDLITHSPWAGHTPIPMGCDCGRDGGSPDRDGGDDHAR